VVSTSIRDVVRPYGERGLARIADDPPSFISAIEDALHQDQIETRRLADAFLTHLSWDDTWLRMKRAIEAARAERQARPLTRPQRRATEPRTDAVSEVTAGV
jgi:UDP-galactopyranose mutase